MPSMELVRDYTTAQEKLQQVTSASNQCKARIDSWEDRKRQACAVEIAEQQRDFEQRKVKKTDLLYDILRQKAVGAEQIIDGAVHVEEHEFIGLSDVEEIIVAMKEILPEEIVDTYTCWNPIQFESDKQAYKSYTFLDRFVKTNGGGTMPSKVFNFLTEALVSITESSGHSTLLSIGIMVALIASMVVAPFVSFGVFALLGAFGLCNGIVSRLALQRLYSVKEYLRATYDEDLFRQDKEDMLQQVDSFLGELTELYGRAISEEQLVIDEEEITYIEKRFESELATIKGTFETLQLEVKNAREAVERLAAAISEEQQQEALRASKAREMYLEKRTWAREWPDQLLFDISQNNRCELFDFTKGNTIYMFRSEETLQSFMQLMAYQVMLRTHPNLLQQIVLDEKYMGGKVISLDAVSNRVLEIVHSDQVKPRLETLSENVRQRVDSILKASPNLEAFNEMMKTYDAPGENYVVIHVCGCKVLPAPLQSILKNGPKVGYFIKYYVTEDDAKALGVSFPCDDFQNSAMIDTHVMPQLIESAKKKFSPAR